MMINHSTFDRLVTFLTRSLGGPEWLFETLTLYSDPNPNPDRDPIPNKAYAETLTGTLMRNYTNFPI